LLQKSVKWNWGDQQQQSFDKSKEMLTSSALLVHYDPTKTLVLSCDASQYSIGAVLSQVDNSDEKPVAYASRILTNAERNYSQLEKEALAIIFGIKNSTIICLEGHLPCILITNPYKASSMNPSLFHVWHQLAYKDGH